MSEAAVYFGLTLDCSSVDTEIRCSQMDLMHHSTQRLPARRELITRMAIGRIQDGAHPNLVPFIYIISHICLI